MATFLFVLFVVAALAFLAAAWLLTRTGFARPEWALWGAAIAAGCAISAAPAVFG